MPKTKWDDAEELTKIYYLTTTVLGDSYGPPAVGEIIKTRLPN